MSSQADDKQFITHNTYTHPNNSFANSFTDQNYPVDFYDEGSFIYRSERISMEKWRDEISFRSQIT